VGIRRTGVYARLAGKIVIGEINMINGLPADLEQFMDQDLAAGKSASRDELLAAAVRLLRERERRVKELREEILPALARLDRGEGEPLDAEDIKARGMRRLAEQRLNRADPFKCLRSPEIVQLNAT
jgi:Arc/MetJ-type ribon-helix-helix transcriptional regulator